ncbi:unnamed protein product, partial [marine sediment metagenome]
PVNRRLKAIYLQGLGNISIGTPIDEGRAANNWFLTENAPFGGTTTLTSGNNSFEERMPQSVIGKKLYYTNNMPYIMALEYGLYKGVGPKTVAGDGGIYSDQAVGGWVRKELLTIRAAIRNI